MLFNQSATIKHLVPFSNNVKRLVYFDSRNMIGQKNGVIGKKIKKIDNRQANWL